MLTRIITLINQILLVDVLLVAIFFLWFVLALVAETLNFHLGWQLWQGLWQPVIQPALGLVMLGAIATGVINKFRLK